MFFFHFFLHNYNYPLNNYIRLLKEDSARYEIYNLKINSASSEFGPCIYSDKLIFSSNRPNRTLINRDDIMTNQPFFGLYQAQRNSLYDLTDPKHFAENIKSNLNMGPICFNREYSLMYITKNNSKTKNWKTRWICHWRFRQHRINPLLSLKGNGLFGIHPVKLKLSPNYGIHLVHWLPVGLIWPLVNRKINALEIRQYRSLGWMSIFPSAEIRMRNPGERLWKK